MIINYDRIKAVNYAKTWAYSRNPDYYSFNELGGDCTNFISQCIYAGAKVMNFTLNLGWYYNSVNSRSPAWTGVEFLRSFLLNNNGVNGVIGNGNGPFGEETTLNNAEIGDIIQLKNNSGFYHSLIIVDFINDVPLVSAHSSDAFGIPLYSYGYDSFSVIKILGARIN